METNGLEEVEREPIIESTVNYVGEHSLSRVLGKLKNYLYSTFVTKQFKTGSTEEYKVLSDNNLSDDNYQKLLNSASQQYVDKKFEDLMGEGVPETLDTLKEIADAITQSDSDVSALTVVVGNKADKNHTHTKADIEDFPDLGTASTKNIPTSGNATGDQVVLGNDTRLTDSRNAKDVYEWAKSSKKPSYSAEEIAGLENVGNFKAVSTEANQELSDMEKENARANIGAGTSNFSGDYNDLDNTPSIPTEETISEMGFTKNKGTITEIKMNNASKGISGVIDLGTVLTEHQDISGKADKANTLKGYGITDGVGVKVLSSENLDTLTVSGFYNAASGNTISNKPSDVDSFVFVVIGGECCTQLLFTDTKSYRRRYVSGTWSDWSEDKLTDTNTWRGIQDNLTSDSTEDSLSAKQGKELKRLIDSKLDANGQPTEHTHSSEEINSMTGYSKPESTSSITVEDSLNSAIGKLEKALDECSRFSGDYNDLTNAPSIPTKVSELENDKKYTSNVGTVTGVKLNDKIKPVDVNGIVDLGVVLTEHQDISSFITSQKANTSELTTAGDPSFAS